MCNFSPECTHVHVHSHTFTYTLCCTLIYTHKWWTKRQSDRRRNVEHGWSWALVSVLVIWDSPCAVDSTRSSEDERTLWTHVQMVSGLFVCTWLPGNERTVVWQKGWAWCAQIGQVPERSAHVFWFPQQINMHMGIKVTENQKIQLTSSNFSLKKIWKIPQPWWGIRVWPGHLPPPDKQIHALSVLHMATVSSLPTVSSSAPTSHRSTMFHIKLHLLRFPKCTGTVYIILGIIKNTEIKLFGEMYTGLCKGFYILPGTEIPEGFEIYGITSNT